MTEAAEPAADPVAAAPPPAHPPGDYAIVEILGHQTLIGRVEEADRFGGKMLRIEPIFAGVLLGPIYQSGASLYRFSPCTAAIAFANAPRQTYRLPEAVRAAHSLEALEALAKAVSDAEVDLRPPLLIDRRGFLGESPFDRAIDADVEDADDWDDLEA